jgi:hypothetical protein
MGLKQVNVRLIDEEMLRQLAELPAKPRVSLHERRAQVSQPLEKPEAENANFATEVRQLQESIRNTPLPPDHWDRLNAMLREVEREHAERAARVRAFRSKLGGHTMYFTV